MKEILKKYLQKLLIADSNKFNVQKLLLNSGLSF
jgi:hypothetical protein